MKKILPIKLLLLAYLLFACGGNDKGSSVNDKNDDNIPSDNIPNNNLPNTNSQGNNSFSSSETKFITKGQKHFAFGESAKFIASGSGTWSAIHGQIDANGIYTTPADLDNITSDSITFTGTAGSETVTISLSPFAKLSNEKFQYDGTTQNYHFDNIQSAVGVAVFRNDTTVQNETILTTSVSSNSSTQKIDHKFILQKEKMEKLIRQDSRYQCSIKRNQQDSVKYSSRQPKIESQKKTAKKSDAALESITQFYHDEGSTKGFKNFQLKYKGKKCLIYSEVNPNTSIAYVSTEVCKNVGDAFEVENKYHENGTPIFDVVTSVFGNPWGIDKNGNKINGGGRDDDEQVVILFYNGGGLYGYFYWIDQEPKGDIPDSDSGYISNGAEIVYLNQFFSNNEISILSTLAHEFQHLCDYNQKFVLDGKFNSEDFFNVSFNDDGPTMFNEGQSVLAEELSGFGLLITKGAGIRGNEFIFNNIDAYRSSLSTFSPSFLSWAGGRDYGKGYLFWRYIYDTYGEATLTQMTTSPLLPPKNIETILSKSLEEILQEFLLALMQAESTKPINKSIAIKSYDMNSTYFDSAGKLLGKLSPLGYFSGFPNNSIPKNSPWEIRLYKFLPKDQKVTFSISGLKTQSSYSIFSVIVDK